MKLHITRHAIQRYRTRIACPDLTEARVRQVISSAYATGQKVGVSHRGDEYRYCGGRLRLVLVVRVEQGHPTVMTVLDPATAAGDLVTVARYVDAQLEEAGIGTATPRPATMRADAPEPPRRLPSVVNGRPIPPTPAPEWDWIVWIEDMERRIKEYRETLAGMQSALAKRGGS